MISVRAAFRAYRSLEESTQDLGAFLRANSRYDAIWARAQDPYATALALAQAGYATDPDWAGKLIALIDGFDLEALDAPDWWPSVSSAHDGPTSRRGGSSARQHAEALLDVAIQQVVEVLAADERSPAAASSAYREHFHRHLGR